MRKLIKTDLRSQSAVLLIGIAAGCLTRLLDCFPLDSLWGFSSIQTALGFWMITNTLIVLLSSSNLSAALGSFLYMFGMTLGFYGLQAVLGEFIPLFSGGFRLSLFLMFTLLSLPCAGAAFILYYWNKESVFSSALYALPVGALASETAALALNLYFRHTLLFQLLIDGAGFVIFGVLFFKRAKSGKLYLFSVALSAAAFLFVLYRNDLAAIISAVK